MINGDVQFEKTMSYLKTGEETPFAQFPVRSDYEIINLRNA